MSVVYWISAWIVMFMLIYVMSKTKAGSVVIYYVAWLSVLLLIVANYARLDYILTVAGLSKGITA